MRSKGSWRGFSRAARRFTTCGMRSRKQSDRLVSVPALVGHHLLPRWKAPLPPACLNLSSISPRLRRSARDCHSTAQRREEKDLGGCRFRTRRVLKLTCSSSTSCLIRNLLHQQGVLRGRGASRLAVPKQGTHLRLRASRSGRIAAR